MKTLGEQLLALQREYDQLRDQRRFEAACAAMTGLLPANASKGADACSQLATKYADALLEELAKPKDGDK